MNFPEKVWHQNFEKKLVRHFSEILRFPDSTLKKLVARRDCEYYTLGYSL